MKKPSDFLPKASGTQSAGILAVVLIIASGSIYFLRDNISVFPSFLHAWTQSDRYALALGFLENGFDFFHPKTFNLATTDGITRVDFPIHEYIVALLMKVTGNHEPIVFRIYTLLYAIIGLVFLFRLSQLFTDSFLKSLFVVCFLFLSPVYLYYADGFLPSIPSLSNAFIGYFFYFRYRKTNKQGDFVRAILFLTLAALARLPFFIFLFAVACQQILEYLLLKKISRKEIKVIGLAFAFFILYQCYNNWLGAKYGTQFLMQLLPPSNLNQLKIWIAEAWSQWKFEYFTIPQYIILIILLVPLIVNLIQKRFLEQSSPASTSRLLGSPLLVHIFIGFTGIIIYFFLMLQQFPDHDYYFIDTFYPMLVLLLIFLASRSFGNKILDRTMWLLIFFLMFRSIGGAKNVLDNRYKVQSWDRVEITRQNFLGSGKFLDGLGVPKGAKVLVLDGYTTNVPFILMNRTGWTVNWTTEKKIREGLSKPFDIVAIQNAFVASDVVRNYPGITTQLKKFADNGLVSFYRKEKNTQTRDQFFGIDSATVLYKLTPNDTSVEASLEYFNLITDSTSTFNSGNPTKILVSGEIQSPEIRPQLISSMNDQYSTYYYFVYELNSYIKSNSWQPLLFQFVLPARNRKSGTVKTYLWNDKKVPYALRNLEVVVYR